MTDIITKDEIKDELDKFVEEIKYMPIPKPAYGNDPKYTGRVHKIINGYDIPKIADKIISKINENIEIARENEGDESQAQFHHLAQFVYLHGDKATKGMFKKLIKRMKGI